MRGVRGLRSESCRRLACGVMARGHDKVVHSHQPDGQEEDDHQPRDQSTLAAHPPIVTRRPGQRAPRPLIRL